MDTQPNFDTFFKHIIEALPKNLLNLHHDLEKNLRTALESALRRMNLVTREEFEVQQAVLTRTRTRLETLEARVATLEATYLPKQLTTPERHP
jgi:BMFP domain-containing protein YqiC